MLEICMWLAGMFQGWRSGLIPADLQDSVFEEAHDVGGIPPGCSPQGAPEPRGRARSPGANARAILPAHDGKTFFPAVTTSAPST